MSLRIRLLLAVGAVALIALLVADVVTYSALRSFLLNQVDQSLVVPQRPASDNPADNNSADSNPGSGGPDTFPVNPSPTSHQFFPRSPILGGFREVRSPSGKVIQSVPSQVDGHSYSPQLPKHITGFTVQPDGFRAVYFTTRAVQSGGPSFRVRASLLSGGNEFIVAAPLDATNSTLNRLLIIELTVTGVALVAAVVLGWWLVGIGLRPLEEVERTAESIAEGELDHRVPGENTKTEVGRMARTINIMLSRIQRAFAERDATEAELRASEGRLRQFVADASHELRTPVSAVSAYAEMYQLGMATSGPELDRAMTGIGLESARMGHLVEDLLVLARLDEGLPLEQKPVELVKLSADAVHTAAAVGPEWPVRLEAVRPVEVRGDPLRLRQVLDNLLSNVRAHTPTGTSTVVRVTRTDDEAVVEVADDGPGLDDEQRSRVFERFYRADPSRSRLKGGAGLGLSIVNAIVTAHKGTVHATSAPGQGASFSVHLPLTYGDPDSADGSVLDVESGAETST
ncbi:MAG TPA: HAMP domain-containing sensor histidine kinase [Acidimicrobiales bacterium]|nr:HAMP domain-containing sensor histidine kinase [Acidimicrobiales bacterium]